MTRHQDHDPATHDRIVEALVATFEDDPLYRWLYGDESIRLDALRAHLAFTLELGFERGHVDVVDDGAGVAVWTDPGVSLLPDPAPFLDLLERFAPHRIEHVLAGMEATASVELGGLDPDDVSVLHLVGVHPDERGRGLGERLVRRRLDLLDQDGTPAGLESSNPRNLSFYRRLGFHELGAVQVPGGGPVMYPMLRATSS